MLSTMTKKLAKKMPNKATADRLDRLLSGAFSGPPTPLKDIPKSRKPKQVKRETTQGK